MNGNAILRWIALAIFVPPRAYAGYGIVLDLSAISIPSSLWRHMFALASAIGVGSTTAMRMITSSRGDTA